MTGPIATADSSSRTTFNVTSGEPAAPPEPTLAPDQTVPGVPAARPDVTIQDVLVEEVSIDGMCGVY